MITSTFVTPGIRLGGCKLSSCGGRIRSAFRHVEAIFETVVAKVLGRSVSKRNALKNQLPHSLCCDAALRLLPLAFCGAGIPKEMGRVKMDVLRAVGCDPKVISLPLATNDRETRAWTNTTAGSKVEDVSRRPLFAHLHFPLAFASHPFTHCRISASLTTTTRDGGSSRDSLLRRCRCQMQDIVK